MGQNSGIVGGNVTSQAPGLPAPGSQARDLGMSLGGNGGMGSGGPGYVPPNLQMPGKVSSPWLRQIGGALPPSGSIPGAQDSKLWYQGQLDADKAQRLAQQAQLAEMLAAQKAAAEAEARRKAQEALDYQTYIGGSYDDGGNGEGGGGDGGGGGDE